MHDAWIFEQLSALNVKLAAVSFNITSTPLIFWMAYLDYDGCDYGECDYGEWDYGECDPNANPYPKPYPNPYPNAYPCPYPNPYPNP